MKVLFAGTPQVAVEPLKFLAAQEDIDVVGVLTRTDAPAGRKRRLTPSPVAQAATDLGLHVIKANAVDEPVLEQIRATGAQVGAVVAYGALLKAPVLAALPLGWVNLHFSALPQWRGAAPVQRSLLAGELTAAATTFVLDPGMDTGPILRGFTETVQADDVAGTVLSRLSVEGAPVLADSLRDLAAGIEPTPQSGVGSLAPKLTAADGRLNWNRPAHRVAARVRAVTPEPGAWCELDGARFKITGPLLLESNTEAALRDSPGESDGTDQSDGTDAPLQPGEVRLVQHNVVVGTGSTPVVLTQVQPAGKKAMAATDWARGRLAGTQPGEVVLV
ncbi:methionyl-tRNA formyltransferase [Kocuria sp.]|uniref:methionyl-tRNA formyltransferase n=1 Tax=Kocuria sp. TaxID=1871328 RepID=UPI0026DF912A|nr:methionyl-tRNA formyltransferase [Kocuria sp.]MDO5619817.1 methionyl-tRNA formyltransferase [Kocuria sp.]